MQRGPQGSSRGGYRISGYVNRCLPIDPILNRDLNGIWQGSSAQVVTTARPVLSTAAIKAEFDSSLQARPNADRAVNIGVASEKNCHAAGMRGQCEFVRFASASVMSEVLITGTDRGWRITRTLCKVFDDTDRPLGRCFDRTSRHTSEHPEHENHLAEPSSGLSNSPVLHPASLRARGEQLDDSDRPVHRQHAINNDERDRSRDKAPRGVRRRCVTREPLPGSPTCPRRVWAGTLNHMRHHLIVILSVFTVVSANIALDAYTVVPMPVRWSIAVGFGLLVTLILSNLSNRWQARNSHDSRDSA